jgi:hypothetical protein
MFSLRSNGLPCGVRRTCCSLLGPQTRHQFKGLHRGEDLVLFFLASRLRQIDIVCEKAARCRAANARLCQRDFGIYTERKRFPLAQVAVNHAPVFACGRHPKVEAAAVGVLLTCWLAGLGIADKGTFCNDGIPSILTVFWCAALIFAETN